MLLRPARSSTFFYLSDYRCRDEAGRNAMTISDASQPTSVDSLISACATEAEGDEVTPLRYPLLPGAQAVSIKRISGDCCTGNTAARLTRRITYHTRRHGNLPELRLGFRPECYDAARRFRRC